MKRGLYALFGIMRNELVLGWKTRLLIFGIILGVVFVVLIGYMVSVQNSPFKHLPVGLYQDPAFGAVHVLETNDNQQVTVYQSEQDLRNSVKQGVNVAGLLLKMNNQQPQATILVDDTQGVVARTLASSISTQLAQKEQALRASQQLSSSTPVSGAQPATPSLSVSTQNTWGLDLNADNYPVRLTAPGLYIMIVTISGLIILGFALVRERTKGTINVLMVAPVAHIWIILGKLAAATIQLLIQILVVTPLVLLAYGGFPAGNLLLCILIVLVTGIGLTGLAYTVTPLARNEDGLRLAFMPIMYPLLILSGILIPLHAFPSQLQSVAQFLPLTWANTALQAVFIKGDGFSSVVSWNLLYLGLFALVMLLLGTFAMDRSMQQS